MSRVGNSLYNKELEFWFSIFKFVSNLMSMSIFYFSIIFESAETEILDELED